MTMSVVAFLASNLSVLIAGFVAGRAYEIWRDDYRR
jgi:hypothetical protein